MSFREIRLPDIVIADLYGSNLVEIEGTTQNTAIKIIPKQSLPKYLGGNSKNILALVHYTQEEHLPGEQFDFLANILKACQLGIADIAIVNTAKIEGDLDNYINSLDPKVILRFGAQKLSIAGNKEITDFNITYLGDIRLVCSPVLDSLKQDNAEGKLLKRKLWECLKKLFNV